MNNRTWSQTDVLEKLTKKITICIINTLPDEVADQQLNELWFSINAVWIKKSMKNASLCAAPPPVLKEAPSSEGWVFEPQKINVKSTSDATNLLF